MRARAVAAEEAMEAETRKAAARVATLQVQGFGVAMKVGAGRRVPHQRVGQGRRVPHQTPHHMLRQMPNPRPSSKP